VYHVQGCNPLIPGGIYVWDGARWNGINVEQPAAPSGTVDIVVKVDANGNGTSDPNTPCRKVLRFMTHNLGALSYEDIAGPNATPGETAKAQMRYTSSGATDPTVFGDLYQWGRKRDGHEKRNSGTTTDQYTDPSATGDLFVVKGSNDWLNPSVDDLWGNGGNFATQTNTTYTGNQNINNPCPAGYRVPTEHEWALLGNEGGNSGNTANDHFYDNGTNCTRSGLGFIPKSNPDIVWVPVSEGKASASWSADGKTRGDALYDATVWAKADSGYKDGTEFLTDPAAPEPLLFLPAAGRRTDSWGNVDGAGRYGRYWSSVVRGALLSYQMTCDCCGFYAYDYVSRAYGMSVRCIAE
jgi:hypothetical protein